ncbi:MAG: amidohydrolase [Pseudomonadota bacterium]
MSAGNTGRWLGALCFAALSAGCAKDTNETDEVAAAFADIVLTSARVFTVDSERPWAESVALRADRIVAIGDNENTAALVGPDTRLIDANGRLVLPGFVDSHTHIFAGSFSAQRINLSLADTLPKLRESLLAIKDQNPGDEAIYARGWQNHIFPKEGPRKELLDEIFGERVVVLGSVDGHSTWFSSKAFELAGVDASTGDPEPGVSFFERDPATGELLGTAREAASGLVTSKVISFEREAYKEALQRWLPEAAAAGLTTVFDAGATAPTTEEAYRILGELEASGELTLRVFGSVGYEFGDDEPSARLLALRERYSGEYFRPHSVKLYADGVPEGHTAFLLDPYVDQPGSFGEPMIAPERMTELIVASFENDVPVHVHAIGGGAIRMTLDAIEAARESTGKQDVAAAIAHMDFVSAEDIPRFAELNVVAQTSIQWAAADPSYANIGSFVGMQKVEAAYPVRSLIDAGALQTFGADWPAAAYLSTYKPLTLLEVAVTRQLPGELEMPVRNRDERLSVEEAIRSLTIRSARQLGQEDVIGSLEPGKKADLIMLEENVLDIEAHRIHEAGVALTIMDGRIVHED